MQTIIGIVICLIVIVIFAIGYMNSYEGLTTAPTSETTLAATATATTTTSPTGSISLKTVVENAEKAATAKETTISLSQNKDDYAELINHLLDYYENLIIHEIANAKQDENED